MGMEKFSFNYFFNRFIIFCNILFTLIMLSFFIIFNRQILAFDVPEYIKMSIPTINLSLLFLGGFLILANIVLLLVNILYNSKQYFKVLEKLDFTDIHTSINILNNINTIDEIGSLGKNIAKLLEIYINYSTLYKKRLGFEHVKAKLLLQKIQQGAIIVNKSSETKSFIIHAINTQAIKILNIELAGEAIGRPLISYLESASQRNFLDACYKETKTMPAIESTIKVSNIPSFQITLKFLIHQAPSSSSSSTNVPPSNAEGAGNSEPAINTVECNVTVFPFIMQFYDDYRFKNPENTNTLIDSLILILEKNTQESPLLALGSDSFSQEKTQDQEK
jgi:hypothetical protein